MADVYKCANCGAVTSEKGHLCDPQPVADKCGYCGKEVDNPRHVCKPMREKLEYVCEACGRAAEQADLLCKPTKIPD
ncbi:MAG: hypothetical protein Kow0092_00320 [Deferrisomatales bacterium]